MANIEVQRIDLKKHDTGLPDPLVCVQCMAALNPGDPCPVTDVARQLLGGRECSGLPANRVDRREVLLGDR